ncbi:kinase-like domain-containing protein [Syncephalis plumigaleata]|nr:kinase-like domain-containing protein [Syncephalis plumigaleata]
MGNAHGHVVDFNAEATLMHFNLLRSVGRGSFGKVRIVERKDTKQIYALKYISKRECIRMDALRNVFRERNILESIDHHYVVNLRFSFQDDDYMYMVTDLMLGGDLRFHLLRKPHIEEDEMRHWLAELACGLGYLHSRGIMHRDVKPDNILLDEYGHVHLTDFNIATHFNQTRRITSESGTYVYMAPEMFTGKGYTQAVDWWALGVIFYEAMYGRRPFDAPNNDALKRKIRDDQPNFPAIGRQGRALSIDCIEAMMMFMERDPQRRLCCGAEGWRELRRVKFFEDINWTKIENKESAPIFVPDSERPNFDVAYDLEELLMEQEPLEARPRRKTDLSRMSKEMQLIEKRFKTFDYLLYERYTGLVDSDRMCVGEPPSWVKCVDPPPAPSSDRDSGIGDPSRGNSEENTLHGQAHPKSDDQGRKRTHGKDGGANNTESRRSISSLKQVLFSGKRWSYKGRERDDNTNNNGTDNNADPAWQNPRKGEHGALLARSSADGLRSSPTGRSIQSPAEAVKSPLRSLSTSRHRHTLLITDNIGDLSQDGALAPLMINTRSNGSNRKPASNIDTDSAINAVYMGQSSVSNESPKPVSFMDTAFPVVTHSASFSHDMQVASDNSLYLSSIEATSGVNIPSLMPDPAYSEKLNTPTFTDAQPVERFW